MSIDKKSVSPMLTPPSLLVLGRTSTITVSLKLFSGNFVNFFESIQWKLFVSFLPSPSCIFVPVMFVLLAGFFYLF